MIAPRVASHVLVGALRRHAESEGGFATVLAKGDESAGAIILLLTDRSGGRRILERSLDLDGRYVWRSVGEQPAASAEAAQAFFDQRRRFDPDVWIVEMETASVEAFAAGLAEFG